METIDERTPLNHDKSKQSRFVITRGGAALAEKRTAPQPLRKRRSAEFVAQARDELALVNAMQPSESTCQQVHALLRHAFQAGRLTCVLLSFCICEGEFRHVPEPAKWEQPSETLRLGDEREISENQLCLDVRPFEQHHRLIASVMIHLRQQMTSHYHVIISRRRVTECCAPHPQQKSWWRRHFEWTREGYYYKILVDFAQSEPLYELKDAASFINSHNDKHAST
jgi:hypothetical protein